MRYSQGLFLKSNEGIAVWMIEPSAMAREKSGESRYDGLEAMRLAGFGCDGARGCPIPHSPKVYPSRRCLRARSPPLFPPVLPHPVPDLAGSGDIVQEARLKPWCTLIWVIQAERDLEVTLAVKEPDRRWGDQS